MRNHDLPSPNARPTERSGLGVSAFASPLGIAILGATSVLALAACSARPDSSTAVHQVGRAAGSAGQPSTTRSPGSTRGDDLAPAGESEAPEESTVAHYTQNVEPDRDGYLAERLRRETAAGLRDQLEGKKDGRWLAKPQALPSADPSSPPARSLHVMTVTAEDDPEATSGERFARLEDFGFVATADEATSTFAAETDTGAYALTRRMLRDGHLPPRDLVRIEEYLNTFDYADAPPSAADDTPFAVHTALADCPWNQDAKLLRIGLKGKTLTSERTPPRNLVFLLDVSGSMSSPDKLGLVQKALGMLTDQLVAKDRVSIVVYAGASGAVLEPTSGADKMRILEAIEALSAGGSTNGAAGIHLAYDLAAKSFDPEAINRVILCTDGDFNVGTSNVDELQSLIEQKRKTGVFLTVFGVGRGNTRDDVMETLARCGNGQYAYLDSEKEARRVLVEQAGGSLVTIAKDVKIQVEFDPAAVSRYRLIGYANRRLANKDFADDTKDAGELGAGHTVTALYEIEPTRSFSRTSGRWADVRLRFKEPDLDVSELRTTEVVARAPDLADRAAMDHAIAIAAFGLALREELSPEERVTALALAHELALGAAELADPFGHRQEFVELAERALDIARSEVRAIASPTSMR